LGWLLKTDAQGNPAWNRTYDYGLYSIVQNKDGGYAVAGDSAVLIITDSYGNLTWSRVVHGMAQAQHSTYFIRIYSLIKPSENSL
jgi:hypothetical protein